MKRFLVVAGNIGVGKSTLTEKLAEALGWTPFLEPHADNPFLPAFYEDKRRWGFHSQLYFLAQRLETHLRLKEIQDDVIQDRSIYEDAEVFARNLFDQQCMNENEYRVYQKLYRGIRVVLPPPTFILYLKASTDTLMRRIEMRGREYERSISSQYLEQLDMLYEQWVTSFTLCPIYRIETDRLDFTSSKNAVEKVVQIVKSKFEI